MTYRQKPNFSIAVVNGRLAKSTTHPHYTYLIRDVKGTVLYVGLTDRPIGRMLGHRATRLWWDQVARIDYFMFPTRYGAASYETQMIRQFRPIGNVVGNGGAANAA